MKKDGVEFQNGNGEVGTPEGSWLSVRPGE
jgi:hypothetical protein